MIGFEIGPIVVQFRQGIELRFQLGNQTVRFYRDRTLKMELTLPSDSEITFVLPSAGADAQGNPTLLKTPPTCRVSDSAILSIVQPNPETPDNVLSGVLSAVGPAQKGQFLVEDIDEGGSPLLILVDVDVVPSETVSLAPIEFGPVRKKT